MSFGIGVWDGNGALTLSMDDFTIQRLAVQIIPAMTGNGAGTRADYIVMDVSGYDPATCFVIITPRVFTGSMDVFTPTYKNLGGTRIGIVTYTNRKYFTGSGNNYKDEWVQRSVESVVEVVKVL